MGALRMTRRTLGRRRVRRPRRGPTATRLLTAVAVGVLALGTGQALATGNRAMDDAADRDAVLREWSQRLHAARQAMRGQATSATESGEAAPALCVGDEAEDVQPGAPEQVE